MSRTARYAVSYLVGVRTKTEVLDSLTGVLGTTEEQNVGAGWRAEGELVECEALTAGLLDASTSSGSEAKGADAELGELEETVVIGDCADDCADLALLSLGAVLVGRDRNNLGERHRWGVDARHTQSVRGQQSTQILYDIPLMLFYAPPQDSGVELALGTAVEERVQLVEQEAVWVVGFRRLNVVLIA